MFVSFDYFYFSGSLPWYFLVIRHMMSKVKDPIPLIRFIEITP